MSEPPSVAVVVVNYNSAPFIEEFRASLRTVIYPRMRLEVIDSGSTDGSEMALAEAMPCVHVTRCADNVGFAGGANIGINAALESGDDFILFLNDDTVLTPDFLSQLVDASDDKTVVVPKILYRDDPRLISTHAGGFDWRRGVFCETFSGTPDRPATNVRRDHLETASFCCALVPTQAFRDAGLLDERFFMYYEETDWLRRARDHGYRIRYEPSSFIYHRESGSSGGGWMTPFKQYYAARNRPYLVRKHTQSRAGMAAFTTYFLATRLVTGMLLLSHRDCRLLRAMMRGTLDYYRGRMGRTLQVRDL